MSTTTPNRPPKRSAPAMDGRPHDASQKRSIITYGSLSAARRPRKPASMPTMVERWLNATRGCTKEFKKRKNENGAALMWDIAVRVIMRNLQHLEREHFEAVPWILARRMWMVFEKNDLMPVNIWRIYHLLYADQIRDSRIESLFYHDSSKVIPSHAQETCKDLCTTPPSHALLSHLSTIAAPSFEWVTALSIYDTPIERRDWSRLATLANLGVLHVENWQVSCGAVDDVIIREWARAARDDEAFSQLKLVLLRNQSAISLGVLDDFAYFPALRALHLAGPTLDAKKAKAKITGKRWLWFDHSKLCERLHQTWHMADYSRDIPAQMHRQISMHDAVGAPTVAGPTGEVPQDIRVPVIKVMSGTGGYGGDVFTLDQLWFELPVRSASTRRKTAVSSSNRGLKRKIRPEGEAMLKEIYSNFGGLG